MKHAEEKKINKEPVQDKGKEIIDEGVSIATMEEIDRIKSQNDLISESIETELNVLSIPVKQVKFAEPIVDKIKIATKEKRDEKVNKNNCCVICKADFSKIEKHTIHNCPKKKTKCRTCKFVCTAEKMIKHREDYHQKCRYCNEKLTETFVLHKEKCKSINMDEYKCFKCKKIGHLESKCTDLSQSRSKVLKKQMQESTVEKVDKRGIPVSKNVLMKKNTFGNSVPINSITKKWVPKKKNESMQADSHLHPIPADNYVFRFVSHFTNQYGNEFSEVGNCFSIGKYIITNAHVAKNPANCWALLSNGTEIGASPTVPLQLVQINKQKDFAVFLKGAVPIRSSIPSVAVGKSVSVRQWGDFGQGMNYYHSSGLVINGNWHYCSTQSGSSGSPVFNGAGKVVGIHSSTMRDHNIMVLMKELSEFFQ